MIIGEERRKENKLEHLLYSFNILSSFPVVTYIVTVYTGKDPGNGTNAEPYINMFGDYGDSGKRWLRLTSRPKPFQKGQVSTATTHFCSCLSVKKCNIGPLRNGGVLSFQICVDC